MGLAQAGQTGPGVEERPTAPSGPAFRGMPPAESLSADLSVTIYERFQQFQGQLEVLTGRIEQLEYELRQEKEQSRVRYLDIDARLNALQQASRSTVGVVGGSADSTAGSAAQSAAGSDDEKAAYARATGLVREKKYDEAIKAFDAQIKDFPRGELTPLAMYWLGEMWLVASAPDAPKAGRYFYRVFNEFPKTGRAGAAMYRYALIQCQDDVSKGRVLLNKVILQYPDTTEAKQAQAALKQQCQ